jgi:hypothetical protein
MISSIDRVSAGEMTSKRHSHFGQRQKMNNEPSIPTSRPFGGNQFVTALNARHREVGTLIRYYPHYKRQLCGGIAWHRTRGVIFLDPFGASLEWETLKFIAATKALDVWYLFPLVRFLEMRHGLSKSSRRKNVRQSQKYSARRNGKPNSIVRRPKCAWAYSICRKREKLGGRSTSMR